MGFLVPARQAPGLAGRYNNPMPELTLSPSQGSMNSATVVCPRESNCFPAMSSLLIKIWEHLGEQICHYNLNLITIEVSAIGSR